MILGIMQPYFFPYLGYFDLIHYSTRWVVFDTVQYIRHGWVNRNRILHPEKGWQYITVPLAKHSRETLIQDVRVSNDDSWRGRILGQLQHYRKKAPFYHDVYELVQECLSIPERSLSRLNVLIIERLCSFLGIRFDYAFFSDMELALGPVTEPGDWALRISEELGAEEYVNPPGGEHLFDKSKFAESGILLTIREFPIFYYNCNGYLFEPHLSLIDGLMWNPAATVTQFFETWRTTDGTT